MFASTATCARMLIWSLPIFDMRSRSTSDMRPRSPRQRMSRRLGAASLKGIDAENILDCSQIFASCCSAPIRTSCYSCGRALPPGHSNRQQMRVMVSKFSAHMSPPALTKWPNHAMERTATRCAFTSLVTRTFALMAKPAPSGRRSSCSR